MTRGSSSAASCGYTAAGPATIEFGRFAAANRDRRGLGKPETFNFLGFTFICGKSRRGNFLLQRQSRRDRRQAKLEEVKEGLWRRLHQPIAEHELVEA